MKFFITRMLFGVVLLIAFGSVQAQEKWTLEQCVRYALENNFTVRQSNAAVRTAQLSEAQAKASRLPNISAGSNLGEQFGRTIDPTTNSFSTQGIGFNSISLNAGINLFAGGQIAHTLNQARWEVKAARADAEQTANTLSLQVAAAFLNVLQAEEQLSSATARVNQSLVQLKTTQKLVETGSQPASEQFSVEAQLAVEEQAQVIARNNIELTYLTLKQLLQLEPDFNLAVVRPEILLPDDLPEEGRQLSGVYTEALKTQPSILSADFRIKSAAEGIGIAKAGYLPSLTAFAGLSANYSTQFKQFSYTGNLIPGQTTIVNVGGNDVPVTFYNPEVIVQNVPYFDQIDQNFGQTIGLSLNVPIYSNGRNRLALERARLGVLNAQLQGNQARQTLKNDIQAAIANVRAAGQQLKAARKAAAASQLAFTNTEKRYQVGAVSTLQLTLAKTNLATAENDLITARYNYLFRLKILDFYEGKPLSLN
jgi:outer membrane protein